MSVTIPLDDPLRDLFCRTMRETFGEVLHGRKPHFEKPRSGYLEAKIVARNLVVEGPMVLDETGEYVILRASINGYLLRSLCGRVNLTEQDFIGWCSLAQTIFDRSFSAPESGLSGIYRAAGDIHLDTDEGPLWLPQGRLVAILNSHLLCDLESSYTSVGGLGIERTPWMGARVVPHPNRHPDCWFRVGWTWFPGRENGCGPKLELLIHDGVLEREYDGDDLMDKNIPAEWHTWRTEEEASIL